MDIKDISNEQVAGGLISIPFAILLFKKLLTLFKSENAYGEAIDARSDVISLLREEVKRLQEENQRLRADVDILIEKLKIVQLRGDCPDNLRTLSFPDRRQESS